jgi:Tat protein translocase TatB subunit
MFEVGFTEIVLIFGIALLVLGPKRLPKLAADVGRWAGRARAMARQLRTQLEQETQYDPFADVRPNPTSATTSSPPLPQPVAAVTPPVPQPSPVPAEATPDEPKPE